MPKVQLMEHFYNALRQLVPLAESVGTAIFVENMPFAFLPGIDELWHAVEEFGDTRIGIVYDVANGHFVKEDVTAALRRCAPRLRVVHLSDTGQQVYRHDAVGLGTVDFRPVPRVLSEIGFRRKPVLEIIANDAEVAIVDSARKLEELGWARTDSPS
jgi:deoxyribonuclease-4